MLTIMLLAWRDADDHRWVVFRYFSGSHGTETEQQGEYAVDRHGGLVLVADGGGQLGVNEL